MNGPVVGSTLTREEIAEQASKAVRNAILGSDREVIVEHTAGVTTRPDPENPSMTKSELNGTQTITVKIGGGATDYEL